MLTLILPDIRSVHNVGSIFRTADAAGVSKIILCGYSPQPKDRFGRKRADFTKVSLGAEDTVAWEYIESAQDAIQKLKDDGHTIAALEQVRGSVNIFDYEAPKKLALIVGNEVGGVSPNLLALCDAALEIPMHGKKESLNVSVATGVALFALIK
ncbi:MAG: tRNA/rRNA methyltransferase SpoU [Candidatus Adlerbacteria bacterium]|nr:tRNA/rRNA methyltransferase SpoU [Candidatus Adlerbacteria bacterium]